MPKIKYINIIQVEKKRAQALHTLPMSPESQDKFKFPGSDMVASTTSDARDTYFN